MKMRHCKYNGCRKLIPFDESYCDTHAVVMASKAVDKEIEQKRLENMSRGYRASERHTRYSNSSRFDEIGAGFYQSSQWRKLSARVRVRDLYTCQVCGKVQQMNESYVVDHIVKRRIDEAKAMDSSNLWLLCRQCHNKKSALEDKLIPEKQMIMTKDEWQQMIKTK